MQNKRLANYLQSVRVSAGLTQRELVDVSGISFTTIRDIEQARSGYKPSLSTLLALAEHVGDYKTLCYLSGRLTPEMEKALEKERVWDYIWEEAHD